MTRSEVLIIGAGPTGLVLALWLTRLGVKGGRARHHIASPRRTGADVGTVPAT
jgi:cation diffusion facilitator CzcD-associated flavoprotein CzcO